MLQDFHARFSCNIIPPQQYSSAGTHLTTGASLDACGAMWPMIKKRKEVTSVSWFHHTILLLKNLFITERLKSE